MSDRVLQALERMTEAADQARLYVEGMAEADFLADRRTQDAQ